MKISPVKPADIDASNHMFNSFGHYETEVSAGWLVRFAQKRGNWNPFTYGELLAFYQKKYKGETFFFNYLFERDAKDTFIVRFGDVSDAGLRPDDVMFFTDKFVAQCFAAAGKKRV